MAWVADLVTTALAATRLSTTVQDCVDITVRAKSTNVASVFFGNSDVTISDNYGVFLAPGEAYTWGPSPYTSFDLHEIFYISANNTDKFALSYNKR